MPYGGERKENCHQRAQQENEPGNRVSVIILKEICTIWRWAINAAEQMYGSTASLTDITTRK
jgi:hypothetical protein